MDVSDYELTSPAIMGREYSVSATPQNIIMNVGGGGALTERSRSASDISVIEDSYESQKSLHSSLPELGGAGAVGIAGISSLPPYFSPAAAAATAAATSGGGGGMSRSQSFGGVKINNFVSNKKKSIVDNNTAAITSSAQSPDGTVPSNFTAASTSTGNVIEMIGGGGVSSSAPVKNNLTGSLDSLGSKKLRNNSVSKGSNSNNPFSPPPTPIPQPQQQQRSRRGTGLMQSQDSNSINIRPQQHSVVQKSTMKGGGGARASTLSQHQGIRQQQQQQQLQQSQPPQQQQLLMIPYSGSALIPRSISELHGGITPSIQTEADTIYVNIPDFNDGSSSSRRGCCCCLVTWRYCFSSFGEPLMISCSLLNIFSWLPWALLLTLGEDQYTLGHAVVCIAFAAGRQMCLAVVLGMRSGGVSGGGGSGAAASSNHSDGTNTSFTNVVASVSQGEVVAPVSH